MNAPFFPKTKQPSSAPSVSAKPPVDHLPQIAVLAFGEVSAVAGGPQVKNDPQG